MTYANTARVPKLKINGVDETARLINWTCTDQSSFKNGFVITTGQLTLGTNNLTQFNYLKNRYKRGTSITMELKNPGTGLFEVHPRGLLYVVGESFDPASQQVVIEMGCKLAMMALTENDAVVKPLAPITLEDARVTFQNIGGSFAAVGQYLYQDNAGTLTSGDCFPLGTHGDPASVETTFTVSSQENTLQVATIAGAAPIPDEIKLSYAFTTTTVDEDDAAEVIQTEESTYNVKYPGVVFARVGSGKIPTDTTGDGGGTSGSVCGNTPQSPSGNAPGSGNAGACSGIFRTIEEPVKKGVTRKEVTTTVYGGPGKQISSVTKETYGPALELNPQYYADRYAYCRFNYATACNPNGTCETEGTNEVLQLKTIETYTYDTDGTLTERDLEEYRPVLAAAQPFDWRAGVVGGVPTDFTEISTATTFRAKITAQAYSQKDDKNVEDTTVSESSAVRSGAGINETQQELTTGGGLIISKPTSFPSLSGQFSDIPVTTISGNGAGMIVSISYPEASGRIETAVVDEAAIGGSGYPTNDFFAGGSGTGFKATVRSIRRYNGTAIEDTGTYSVNILEKGSGYTKDDLLTWTRILPGQGQSTIILRVSSVDESIPSVDVTTAGTGYAVGDELKLSKVALSAANGAPVSKPLLFGVTGAADTAVDGGKSIVSLTVRRRPQVLNKGHYTNVPVEIQTGSGGGASVNIEAINTGTVSEVRVYQRPRVNTSDEYVKSIGEVEPTGGSGRGLKLELGIGEFEGVGELQPKIIAVRKIIDSGTGYKAGDILTVPHETIEDNFNLTLFNERTETIGGIAQNAGPHDLKMVLTINTGEIFVFPNRVGANFEVGDRFRVLASTLEAIGATEGGTINLGLTVSKISSEKELGSLRLDAAEGVITTTSKASSTKSTLPDAPDTLAAPQIQTETVETTIPFRTDMYDTELEGAAPYVLKESIPVPLVAETREDVETMQQTYGDYLKNFVTGEVLGLQITTTMSDEIMSDWSPMTGFRYSDNFSGQTMAMRADSATWSVSATEAAVSLNGIWIGNVEYDNSGAELTLDQGNYVQQLNVFHNYGQSTFVPGTRSGLLTPFKERPTLNDFYTAVIAVEGLIVENGGTLTTGAHGSIPASYRGNILVDNVVIVDEDVFSDD